MYPQMLLSYNPRVVFLWLATITIVGDNCPFCMMITVICYSVPLFIHCLVHSCLVITLSISSKLLTIDTPYLVHEGGWGWGGGWGGVGVGVDAWDVIHECTVSSMFYASIPKTEFANGNINVLQENHFTSSQYYHITIAAIFLWLPNRTTVR